MLGETIPALSMFYVYMVPTPTDVRIFLTAFGCCMLQTLVKTGRLNIVNMYVTLKFNIPAAVVFCQNPLLGFLTFFPTGTFTGIDTTCVQS